MQGQVSDRGTVASLDGAPFCTAEISKMPVIVLIRKNSKHQDVTHTSTGTHECERSQYAHLQSLPELLAVAFPLHTSPERGRRDGLAEWCGLRGVGGALSGLES